MPVIKVCEAIIINDKKQFLLQLRDIKEGINGSGRWGLIGGGLEVGEEPLACLNREVGEEIGLSLVAKFLDTVDDRLGDVVYRHYIFCLEFNGRPEDLKLMEGQKIDFFNLEQIPQLDTVAWFNAVYYPLMKKIL